MRPILFAAHDPGSANVIRPLLRRLRAAGRPVLAIGSGPALTILDASPHAHGRAELDGLLSTVAPSVVVTGAGAPGIEQTLWQAAAAQGIPSFAVVDVAFRLRQRFVAVDGAQAYPSDVGVLDAECAAAMAEEAPGPARVHVVGNPYFEEVADGAAPPDTALGPPVFFSEPWAEMYGDSPADQYSLAAVLAEALAAAGEHHLAVRPHPLEGLSGWQAWREAGRASGLDVSIVDGDSHKIGRNARLVTGIITAMLVECALAGRPTLSIQIGRPARFNRMVDDCPGIVVVRAVEDVAPGIERALMQTRQVERPEWARNAVVRALAVVEALAAGQAPFS